jgi:uncharacterized membrane protein
MTSPTKGKDRLVEEYLAAVADACAGLPAARRSELIDDLREHIAVARARLDRPGEADIRTILDRLGEPAAIAAEARANESPNTAARMPAWTAEPRVPQRASPLTVVVVVAVLAFVAFIVAMVVGVAVFLLPV